MKVETIRSNAPRPLAHYVEGKIVGPWVFAAGQIASDYKTGVAPEARRSAGAPGDSADIRLQTRYVLENLKQTFAAAGSSLDQVVKAQAFLTDLGHVAGLDEVWREYFKVPPPRTIVGTTGLLVPGTLVEIDLIGYVPGHGIERRVVTADVPALANSSPAFTVGDLIFAAGQTAGDGSEIRTQTHGILGNLKRIFGAAGGSIDDVFKAQVFLKDLRDFAAFDEVWKEYFKHPPARTTIGTSGLPEAGARIGIDLIGHVRGEGSRKEAIRSRNRPPLAHYAEAYRIGDLVFAAGQLAGDFKTGIAAEARVDPAFPYYGSPIKRQARHILGNIKTTLEAAGSSLENVIKAQVFLTDLNNFFAFDEVWKEFFPSPPPRTTVGTTGLLVDGALVEIDVIAVRT